MRKFLCWAATAAVLSGCGFGVPRVIPISIPSVSAPAAGQGAAASRPVEVSHPRFDDAHPQPWTDRRPDHYAVHGIDVSRWQRFIDWNEARRNGISFAFIKATEGQEDVDPRFSEHWAGAEWAGIPHAAYHFYYFCAPAAAQARWFIQNVPRSTGGLPHVLDMEWNPHSKTCRVRPDGAEVRRQADTFLDILEAHYGQRPVVYTTVDFWQDTGIGQLPGTRFWVRSVAAHPNERYPGANWDFWQYTGTGRVPGVEGLVDINVFRGSRSDWARYP